MSGWFSLRPSKLFVLLSFPPKRHVHIYKASKMFINASVKKKKKLIYDLNFLTLIET